MNQVLQGLAASGLLLLIACGGSEIPGKDAPSAKVAVSAEQGISVILRDSLAGPDGQTLGRAFHTTAGRIPAAPQRQGDAQSGRRVLLEEAYVSCGLPERVYRELMGNFEPALGIGGRTAAADGLPYNVNVYEEANGQRVVSNNCLSCHATPLFGELVMGLGNEFLDFTGDASALVERAGLLVRGEQETRTWEKYADRIAAIAPYMRPHTVGVNPANNLTFALIAHRRAEDNAWSSEPLLPLPPKDPPPVSVPPWWRMKKKTAMFSMGELRGDHARMMMAASMLCTDSLDELEAIDAFAPDLRAYLASLEPPPWPFDVDPSLAERGRSVFEQTCSQCHGSYGDEPFWPAQLVPLEIIDTDPRLVEFAYGPGTLYIDWFNRSWYGQLATAAPGPGYVAPPLDGIWATAPYLHNGSVPNLRLLLDSPSRPVQWRHLVQNAQEVSGYDGQNLGWYYETIEQDREQRAEPARIYDTRLPGYANTGHRFGDHLSDEARTAVLEYLKTL